MKNEEDLINKDKKFIVDEHSNDDYSSKRGREENSKLRQNMEREEMIRLLIIGDDKLTVGSKQRNDD